MHVDRIRKDNATNTIRKKTEMEDMNKAESEDAGRKKGETVYECDASK